MEEIKCFHQVFRPPKEIGKLLRDKGFGDCNICETNHEENKKCQGYQPTKIKPITFFVFQKESQ